MQIDKQGDLFVARIKFSEREVFRRAGWLWNPILKKWTTSDILKVLPLKEFTVDSGRLAIERYQNGVGKVVEASMAVDSDIEIPMPNGAKVLFPYQKAGVAYGMERTEVLIADPPGLGKANSIYSKISTPYGWKLMKDIKVGDVIHGRNGKPQTVIGVYPQGVRAIYRVTFRDGTYADCDLDHLWAVKDQNAIKRGEDWRVKSLKELLKWGIKKHDGKNKWCVPLADPMEYEEVSLPIHPYVLGALLGDGCLGSGTISLTKGGRDQEILDRVIKLVPPDIQPYQKNYQGDTQVLNLTTRKLGVQNSLVNALCELNLRVKGELKFIPDLYKFSSVEQRLELLRGLMDTDGSAKDNRIAFHTCCERLGKDVADLVRSLGGVAISRKYTRSDGKSDEWQINVKITNFCPFYLERKAKHWWKPSKKEHLPSKYIEDVSYLCDEEAQCIAVSNEDHLYVTDDYIVTHNTAQAICIVNGMRKVRGGLIICPASLKKNWMREWKMWSYHRHLTIGEVTTVQEDLKDKHGNLIRGEPKKPGTLGPKKKVAVDVWPDTDIVIINKQLFERHEDALKDEYWDFIIIDEAHDYCNEKAQTSMHIWGGGKGKNKVLPVVGRKRIFLTGTPITTRPRNLWPFVKAMDPKGLGKDWFAFHERYCGGEETSFGYYRDGATNLEELNLKLRSSFMVRRDKKEVLKDLPPKTREIILLPNDNLATHVEKELTQVRSFLDKYEKKRGIEDPREAMEVLETVSADFEDMEYEDIAARISNRMELAFEEMSAARCALALAKAPLVKEHVDRILETGEKVILFCYHKEVAAYFKKAYSNICAFVTGATPTNRRQEQVDLFQEDPDCRIFIGNIAAAGVGFTLTAASIVIFAEISWVPSELEQAEDRAWRIGQMCNVLVQHLVIDGSIDARMIEIILDRIEEIERALDAKHVRQR